MSEKKLISEFIEKASMVSAIVHGVTGIEDALEKTIQICRKKAPCENLMPHNSNPSGKKNIAAPNLDTFHYDRLQMLCEKNDIILIKEDVRSFPGGLDIGVTLMNYGIAETGTLVLNSDSEETRLATMLCETHVAIIDKAHIRKTALDMSDELNEMTREPSSYTAFITGASRTADIERVLAIGVHGPLELHIILVEGN